MKLKIFKNSNDIYNDILNNNNLESKVLLLPTGSTPLGLYKEIINRKIDLSNIITFNLDEYYPIEKNNVDSYYYYMWNNFFSHTNINPYNINLLDGMCQNHNDECDKYHKLILSSMVDIAFLGIGVNGHIAFNEPQENLNSSITRLVELTESTQNINNIKYTQALTVGIDEILASKKIILMAIGMSKADIIYEILNNTITPTIPATLLYYHSCYEMYVDEMAFSKVLTTLSKTFMKYNKIMIMSPHPDDDVIGMGATIKKMVDCNKDVTIMYQTSGANGGNIMVRQKEAIEALKILGVNENKIIFGNSPFYINKTNETNMDILYTLKQINSIKPDVIFLAGDTCDPHKTHLKCYKIIQKCLETYKIDAYNYYSVWSKPINSYNIKEYFDSNLMKLKRHSIKAHTSQIEPTFVGDLKSSFHQVIEERNKIDADNIYSDIYVEGFMKYYI